MCECISSSFPIISFRQQKTAVVLFSCFPLAQNLDSTGSAGDAGGVNERIQLLWVAAKLPTFISEQPASVVYGVKDENRERGGRCCGAEPVEGERRTVPKRLKRGVAQKASAKDCPIAKTTDVLYRNQIKLFPVQLETYRRSNNLLSFLNW